jgi:hypothetical protein
VVEIRYTSYIYIYIHKKIWKILAFEDIIIYIVICEMKAGDF